MKKLSTITALLAALILVFIPMLSFGAEPQPSQNLSPALIAAGFTADKSSVSPGETVKLDFKIKNTSSVLDVRNVNIRLSGGEALIVNGGSDSVYADKIAKNATYSFSKTFYCSPQAAGGVYPVALSATYEYFDGGEKLSGTAEINYSVHVSQSAVSASLTPQILISNYSYGGDYVSGGAVFDLNFTLKNTSKKIAVQNVVVKLSGGEVFVPDGATDTDYAEKLSSELRFSKKMKCAGAAASGVYPVTVSVSYEYFDGGEKVSQSAELSMSVRVQQPESVAFGQIALSGQSVPVNQEQDCAFSVINSGKSAIANGWVKLLDADGNELTSAYIGNIEAGGQFASNYTLPVTFKQAGAQNLTLVFDYENDAGETKSVSKDFSVTAQQQEDPYAELQAQNEVTQGEGDYTLFYLIGAVLAVVILVVVLLVVKRRKSKKGGEEPDEEI